MIPLKPGDIFLTANPMSLGRAINAVQTFWAMDRKSTYGHAGIITSVPGTTFEALWTVKRQNIWKDYRNQKLLIARHKDMTHEDFMDGFEWIREQHEGDWYPVYRLVFHLFPPLAKLATGHVVCSELVAKFLWSIKKFPYFNGVTPDKLHDHIRWGTKEGRWEIVYERTEV